MRTKPLLLVGIIAIGLTQQVSVAAAPNPYGSATSAYRIEINSDGGYQVEHAVSQQLNLAATIEFATIMPDVVRLPDAAPGELPVLLRVGLTDAVAEFDGDPVEVSNDSIGHRLDYSMPAMDRDEGNYTGLWRYQRPAASLADTDGLISSYLQLPGPGDVQLSVPAGLVEVLCQARPGAFVDCGQPSGGGWQLSSRELVEASNLAYPGVYTLLVRWRSADAELAPAELIDS